MMTLRPARRRGFTLIELMVVVAIVVMAMGIMIPTLLEFFRNQKLKAVQSHFVAAFNMARLMAIQEGTDGLIVFFREGVRVYNQKNKAFRKDEEFNPESAPGALEGIHFKLGFANGKMNDDLRPYREWEKDQPSLNLEPGPSNPLAGQCDVRGLPAVMYRRDGSVVWLEGADVPTTMYNDDPPKGADIMVTQDGNDLALYVDIRNTGPARAKFGPKPPDEE